MPEASASDPIDIRDMPRRYQEAVATIFRIRMFLGCDLGAKSEIPLAHEDGTPYTNIERDMLLADLNGHLPYEETMGKLVSPVATFVRAMRRGLAEKQSEYTTPASH